MKKEQVKIGMVVRLKSLEKAWVRIRSKADEDGNFYIDGHADTWAHISEVRPLTARERGDSTE